MPKRYPPLTPREVVAILRAREFEHVRTRGSHEYYGGSVRGQRRMVTVDTHYREFSPQLITSMILQSGLTRAEFYGSTESTARKINLRSDQYPIPIEN
jgi:predicted RNA binding protein YcfA (HicA-like mRNA interferase family)